MSCLPHPITPFPKEENRGEEKKELLVRLLTHDFVYFNYITSDILFHAIIGCVSWWTSCCGYRTSRVTPN